MARMGEVIHNRRRFLFGAGASLVAVPAIVRVAAHLMPVSARALPFWSTDGLATYIEYVNLGEWLAMRALMARPLRYLGRQNGLTVTLTEKTLAEFRA
jgi:hypothetical protein